MRGELSRARWRKSSYSADSGSCVEVAQNLPGLAAVRDSKDPHGPALSFSPHQFADFIALIKINRFES